MGIIIFMSICKVTSTPFTFNNISVNALQFSQRNPVLGHDLAGRVSAQAGFILYSKTMSAPMLHIAMISQKELAMALYENQTFVSWSPLLGCFIGSMNANKSLQKYVIIQIYMVSHLAGFYRRRSNDYNRRIRMVQYIELNQLSPIHVYIW